MGWRRVNTLNCATLACSSTSYSTHWRFGHYCPSHPCDSGQPVRPRCGKELGAWRWACSVSWGHCKAVDWRRSRKETQCKCLSHKILLLVLMIAISVDFWRWKEELYSHIGRGEKKVWKPYWEIHGRKALQCLYKEFNRTASLGTI